MGGTTGQTAFACPPERIKVIACGTVMEELAPRMPAEMAREVLDFGLHARPGSLHGALQAAVDEASGFDAVLLGYGMCSRAVVGLRATHCRLVIPRVDDCIAIFLGSRGAYEAQARGEPGTYYVTKGWIRAEGGPFADVERLAERYGPVKAERIVRLMLRNYTRLAFIETGAADAERYRAQAQAAADRFELRFERIEGSATLIERLLAGPWDREFVVVEPGDRVTLETFLRREPELEAGRAR